MKYSCPSVLCAMRTEREPHGLFIHEDALPGLVRQEQGYRKGT
jgi:hypothetical protein